MSTLAQYKALGFELATYIAFSQGGYRIQCSRCDAVTVNNVPVHERGCQNERHECAGCNALLPMQQKYCKDCK